MSITLKRRFLVSGKGTDAIDLDDLNGSRE